MLRRRLRLSESSTDEAAADASHSMSAHLQSAKNHWDSMRSRSPNRLDNLAALSFETRILRKARALDARSHAIRLKANDLERPLEQLSAI